MKTKRIGIIANPLAGAGYRALEPIHREATSNDNVSLYITTHVRELSTTILKLINNHHVELLAIYGGDGTLHKVVDMLIYEKNRGNISETPPLASLNGGTMNAVFKWLGWEGENSLDIFQKLLQTDLDTMPLRKLRPLQISFHNANEKPELRYGFVMTMGCVHDIIELYERDGKSPINGVKHTVLGALATLTNWPKSHSDVLKPFKTTTFFDEKKLDTTETLCMFASVTDTLLFGIKPFVGQPASNQFYCLSYSMTPLTLGLMLPLELRARWMPPIPQCFNQPIFTFRVTPEIDKRFFIDGEYFTAKSGYPLKIELGPDIEMVSHFD